MTKSENPKGLGKPLGFLIVLFALAYTQAPLFSSNQNQYFLHGMAQAGMGSLQADWLASTLDPTPVFSFFIYIFFSITRMKEGIYLLYAALMGVYLFSLLSILDHLFQLRASRTRSLLTVSAIVILHSAALRFVFVRLLGPNWAFFFDGGLAGQRLLGPVFQPSVFGVFLLLSLSLFLSGRRFWAVLSAVLAAIVHPTYLLTAGLLCTGYLIVTGPLERRWKQAAWMGLLALAAVAPVLVYVYGSFGQTAQPEAVQIAAEARRILVEFRIPHHAQIATWFDLPSVLKLGLIAAALAVVRKQRALFAILLTISLASTVLTILQVLSGSPVLALLFPWRSSALIVPLCTALLVGAGLQRLPDARIEANVWLKKTALAVLLLAALAGAGYTLHDFQQQAAAPERAVLAWVAENSRDSDRYLIPIKMENFRLQTLRPAYVDFMSIPYAGPDVLKWYYRLLSTDRFYRERPCSKVKDYVFDDGITHILSETGQPFSCGSLVPVYEDAYYTVYRVDYELQ